MLFAVAVAASLRHAADVGGAGEWAFLLHVEVSGRRDGKDVRYEYTSSHPPRARWGTSATAGATGVPASIGAQKLARGEATRTGVVAPEVCFEPTAFTAQMTAITQHSASTSKATIRKG